MIMTTRIYYPKERTHILRTATIIEYQKKFFLLSLKMSFFRLNEIIIQGKMEQQKFMSANVFSNENGSEQTKIKFNLNWGKNIMLMQKIGMLASV